MDTKNKGAVAELGGQGGHLLTQTFEKHQQSTYLT